MKKQMIMAASALAMSSLVTTALAEADWLHVSGGSQFGTSYQLYGALFNDEPYLSYQASIDFDIPDAGSIGIGSWTMNDLTHREWHTSWWNTETDLDLHWFYGCNICDNWDLNIYVGHIWFLFYHNKGEWHSQRSWIWGMELENPYITPFAAFEYEYAYLPGFYGEFGGKHRFSILDDIIGVTPSISISYMGHNFKESLFPYCEDGYSSGTGAFFAKCKADWKMNENLTCFIQMTWVSVIDEDIRDCIDNDSGTYKSDFAIAEIGFTFNF